VRKANQSTSIVSRFLRHESGSAAVEYAVVAMAMFMAIIPAFVYVSSGIGLKFQSIVSYFSSPA
jgi:Flp pilus assembly pilin Flp